MLFSEFTICSFLKAITTATTKSVFGIVVAVVVVVLKKLFYKKYF
jgi:hypothetical protein